MPKITVILPSLREHCARDVIREFRRTQQNFDYEIILISPFTCEEKSVVHILEEEPKGVISAMNVGYSKSNSEYIALWSDDAMPTENCLSIMYEYVKNQEEPFVSGFSRVDSENRIMEDWSVYDKLYVGWLCASKSSIEKVGGLFKNCYINFWADPDLCLRVWSNSGKVAICEEAKIVIHQVKDQVKTNNVSKSFKKDTETFISNWQKIYGVGYSKTWWKFNKQIPTTLNGKIKAFLRHIPFLKPGKDYITKIFKQNAGI